jgi:sensor histidine kinase regulating citrate/malate metabolism
MVLYESKCSTGLWIVLGLLTLRILALIPQSRTIRPILQIEPNEEKNLHQQLSAL